MKKIIIIALLSATLFFIGKVSVNAELVSINDVDPLGTYASTEQVPIEVKIYISADMVGILESTGTTIYTETIKNYFLGFYINTTYKYYYYSKQYITKIVTERELYADMDSVIFIVKELENFASQFDACQVNVTDCVLGYIRGINKTYVYGGETGPLQWIAVCGDLNRDFIDFVDSKDGNQLEIAEFFAAFVSYSEYNYIDYGIDDGYSPTITYDDNCFRYANLDIKDPINDDGLIDIVHMFSSMDGIYNRTNGSPAFYLPNLVSWAGDLQTFAAILSQYNVNTTIIQNEINYWNTTYNKNVDFCDLIGIDSCKFPDTDMLADIDAMNIMRLFINGVSLDTDYVPNNYNTISNSLLGYYNTVKEDNSNLSNRYKLFLTAVNSMDGFIWYENLEENLRNMICESMYIEFVNNQYVNLDIYAPEIATKLTYKNIDGEIVTANFNSRIYAAILFDEYINYMASSPYYS